MARLNACTRGMDKLCTAFSQPLLEVINVGYNPSARDGPARSWSVWALSHSIHWPDG